MTRVLLKGKAPRSRLEDTLAIAMTAYGLPPFQREYRFAPPRRFRFDFAWPDRMVAVEVDGAVWTQGRHTRGYGYSRDCEKYNLAASLGWTVLRYTAEMVNGGEALAQIAQVLEGDDAA